MRERDEVLAILCADIHLSKNPPRCRRHEPDWFEAMHRALAQINSVASHYNAPIICSGDIFDHWKAEPHLINFALNHLPEMYAIPGQHDLPLHNIELIQRSAFWTLALAGKIHPVMYGVPIMAERNLVLHGFPWGHPLKALEDETTKKYHVALVHDYLWVEFHSFPGAPEDHEASHFYDRVKGYHAVVFGDNHKGFKTLLGKTPVFNCGGLMRRKTDEKDYEPQIGLLCKSGHILIHKLNTNTDKFEEKEKIDGVRKKMGTIDLEDFLCGLEELHHENYNFIEAMEYALKKRLVNNKVRKIILEALGRG